MTVSEKMDRSDKKKYRIVKQKDKYVILLNGNQIFNSQTSEGCLNFYRYITNYPFKNTFEFELTTSDFDGVIK
jgi:hypothetical protein